MSVSTHGLRVKTSSQLLRSAVELLSSMRFAIALLTVICIASIIGTVLKQGEPPGNYINQFGPFWAEVFMQAQLHRVYSAWWFLVILAFLVISTSLCIARSTPKILADLKVYKEDIREQSLRAFGHRASVDLQEDAEVAAQRIGKTLAGGGWKVKLQRRETAGGVGWMVVAKAGAANKIGYIAAHSAIVLICIGGLLDGDLIVRAQMLFNGKTPFTGGGIGRLAKEGNHIVFIRRKHDVFHAALCFDFIDKAYGFAIAGGEGDDVAHAFSVSVCVLGGG